MSRIATYPCGAFSPGAVAAAKARNGRSVSVCIPAHNEARTVARVVAAVAAPHLAAAGGSGLVDELLVVDDGSSDATAEEARAAGARVVALPARTGKGGAMRAGLEAAGGDVLLFLDADVEDTTPAFVTNLLGPLFCGPADVALVKGCYERPIDGSATGGGRVTELVARPLIEVLFPELADVRQPLAGESAAHRWVLEKVGLADGYGVELALLVDVAARFGAGAVAQADLGTRTHRNRPLAELRPQAVEVLRAALDRAGIAPAGAAPFPPRGAGR